MYPPESDKRNNILRSRPAPYLLHTKSIPTALILRLYRRGANMEKVRRRRKTEQEQNIFLIMKTHLFFQIVIKEDLENHNYFLTLQNNLMTMTTNDDILLLKLIKEGDEHAFKHLFDNYFTPLCRYINIYLDNFAEAEELALDIFTYLWENREQVDIRLSFKAYLFQAARNRCFNALRDRKQTTTLDENLHETLQYKEYPTLEIEELNKLIQEAICTLPDRCREVFLKSRQEQMANQEIADDMNISVKTVEAQITKALKIIKKSLGEGYAYLF